MAIRDWDHKHFETIKFHRTARASVLISPEGENWHLSLVIDNGAVASYSVRREQLGQVITAITNDWNPTENIGSLVIGWSVAAAGGSTGPGNPGSGGGPHGKPHGSPTVEVLNVQTHFQVLALTEVARRNEAL